MATSLPTQIPLNSLVSTPQSNFSPLPTESHGSKQSAVTNSLIIESAEDLLKTSVEEVSGPCYGKLTTKKQFQITDLLAVALSLVCLAMATTAVANTDISWRLGVCNRQLIVLGTLLSIMNLCLASVTPILLVLLEARFGPSSLHNYDNILRNQPFARRLAPAWRFLLVLLMGLPLV